MKVECDYVGTFAPRKFTLTIESENELKFLWHVFGEIEDGELRDYLASVMEGEYHTTGLWERGTVNFRPFWLLLDNLMNVLKLKKLPNDS